MDQKAVRQHRAKGQYRMELRSWFPNRTAAGSFDPTSQTIQLEQTDGPAFMARIGQHNFAGIRHDLATLFHEITHWADTIGTVWGREYLRTLYAAYDVLQRVKQTGSEHEFSVFMDLRDRMRRFMHAEYFRVVAESVGSGSIHHPWTFQMSCGREFDASGHPNDNRPIIFAKFGDQTTGQQVARQPITAGALLETCAVHSEISVQFPIMAAIPDASERSIERAMFKRELEGTIYDPALTLYTAPVHVVANSARITDPVEAYEWGARIAFLCLNLNEAHFRKLVFPAGVSLWHEMFGGFRSARDPGVAFALVCSAGGQREEGETAEAWLARALQTLGLPPEDDVLRDAQATLAAEPASRGPTPLSDGHEYLKQLGNDLLALRRQHGPALTLTNAYMRDVALPPFFDRQGDLIPFSAKPFDQARFDSEAMYGAGATLLTWMLNFQAACR